MDRLLFSDTALNGQSGGKHLTTLVFLFGLNVVDSLAVFLRSTPDCQLAFFKKKKKIVQGKTFKLLSQWYHGKPL